MKFFKRFYWIFVSVLLIALDQFTKMLVVKEIPLNDSLSPAVRIAQPSENIVTGFTLSSLIDISLNVILITTYIIICFYINVKNDLEKNNVELYFKS